MKGLITIGLLVLSNIFMTMAWYGVAVVLISWGIALFEYFCQVPANRIGFRGNGGPFSLVELKVIQEVVSLTVFTLFVVLVFRTETLRWNHAVGFLFLICAVYFIFKH